MEIVNYQEVYDSMKSAIIDIAGMEDNGVNDMKKFIYEHGQSGDLLRLNVSVLKGDGRMKDEVIEAEFVGDKAEYQINQTNLLLPFQDNGPESNVTIGSQNITYDGSKIFVDGVEKSLGSNFMLDGRHVSIAKGSIVIILEDDLINPFPIDGIQNEIIENEGAFNVGDLVTTNTFLVEKKETSGDTSISSYIYFRNTVTDQRICGLEYIKTVDNGVTSASGNIRLGHVDDSSVRTVQDVVEYASINTRVRSIDQSLDENTTSIELDGISFTSDSAALLLGENSEFGIFYDDANDVLQIKYFDTASGEYVTKREFTNN